MISHALAKSTASLVLHIPSTERQKLNERQKPWNPTHLRCIVTSCDNGWMLKSTVMLTFTETETNGNTYEIEDVECGAVLVTV